MKLFSLRKKEQEDSYDKALEKEVSDLMKTAENAYDENNFEKAIQISEKALVLTKSNGNKITLYNRMGYYYLRNGKVKKSIIYFKEALKIEPYVGLIHCNLAYAYIKLGKLWKAKHRLRLTEICGNNSLLPYHHTNLGLYYQAQKNIGKVEKHFKLAFDEAYYESIEVELLNYHYGIFLIEQGNTHEGIKHIKRSADKNEPEAIKYLENLIA